MRYYNNTLLIPHLLLTFNPPSRHVISESINKPYIYQIKIGIVNYFIYPTLTD